MHLMRCLALIECSFHFTLVSRHIPGKHNDLADTLPETIALTLLLITHRPSQHQPQPQPHFSHHLPATQLDLDHLGKSVWEYYIQGLAPSTTRTYKSAKTWFITFCSSCNQSPIPVSENLVCYYVAHLANKSLAHLTIKTYLSAVHQISGGYLDPKLGNMPRLSQVMRGIKSQQAKQGCQSRLCLPISPTILRQLKQVWDKSADNFGHIMLWAASTRFFGFMRAGEITVPSHDAYDSTAHLSFKDIAVLWLPMHNTHGC